MSTEVAPATQGHSLADQPKVFGLFSMVLFSVSAVLVADTVATSAAIGVQGITFWIALAVLFFFPTGSSPPSWAAPGRTKAVSMSGSERRSGPSGAP